MILYLSNGDKFYVEQNNIKLLQNNNHIYVVGDNSLFGITEDGTRYCINPEYDNEHLKEGVFVRRVVDAIYDPATDTYENIYGDVFEWQDTNITLTGNIPSSMNADDTYNFDNFGIPMLLVFLVAIFVSFRVFNR